jgi:tetratricopeptide (TPR) repeat protein
MAGQWKRWICAGLLASAIGCKQNQQFQPVTPGMPQQQSTGVSRYFGGSSGFQPQAPANAGTGAPEMAMMHPARKPGQKGYNNPDTDVAMASTEIAAALERETPLERDALFDQARQKLQIALQKDPKNKAAHIELAKLYTYTNEKPKAIAVLAQARQHHPKDHEIPFQQARICVTYADWAGGLEAINVALAIDPENRNYHKVAGVCLAQMQRYDQAQTALMKVMSESQAVYFIGRVMIDQNQVERGKIHIEQAAALDPKNSYALQFLEDYAKGNIKPMDSVTLVEHQQPVGQGTPVNPADGR